MINLREERVLREEIDQRDKEWREGQAREERRWRVLELIVMGVLVTAANVWGMIYAARLQNQAATAPAKQQLPGTTSPVPAPASAPAP
jgi:hypothetical protein